MRPPTAPGDRSGEIPASSEVIRGGGRATEAGEFAVPCGRMRYQCDQRMGRCWLDDSRSPGPAPYCRSPTGRSGARNDDGEQNGLDTRRGDDAGRAAGHRRDHQNQSMITCSLRLRPVFLCHTCPVRSLLPQ